MIAFIAKWALPSFLYCLGIGFGLGVGLAMGFMLGMFSLLSALT